MYNNNNNQNQAQNQNQSTNKVEVPEARAALNQLQKDEQQHGEALYQYMQRNAMAS